MKKAYLYLGAAALIVYLLNKKKNTASAKNSVAPADKKFTYTVPQIQSWDTQTLTEVKAELQANPTIYADPQTYLSTINAELFKRQAVATASKPPVPTNTGVVNTSPSTTVSTSANNLPPTSTYSPLGPLTKL
jgi:hypothetical protein